MLFFENSHILPAIAHTTGGSARTGDWASLENYHKIGILVAISQGHASTTAITVDKATSNAGAGESTGITLNNWWKLEDVTVGTTVDTWTKGAAAASITTPATGSGMSYYWIEIDASELPASGVDYDHVQVELGASNASNLVQAFYFMLEPRYAQALTPSAQ